MRFTPGQLISFSGVDGAGKSTQISLLLEDVHKRGQKPPVYLWSRGGYTGPFNAVKAGLRTVMGKRLPPPGQSQARSKAFQRTWVRTLWLSLAILDLTLVYGIYVRMFRASGRVVIVDRYLWDTWIDFQLNFSDVDVDQWALWNCLDSLTPRPDVSFLLTIPVEESIRRSKKKNEPFPDTEERLRKRADLYEKLSSQNNWYAIDCLQSVDRVHEEIRRHLSF